MARIRRKLESLQQWKEDKQIFSRSSPEISSRCAVDLNSFSVIIIIDRSPYCRREANYGTGNKPNRQLFSLRLAHIKYPNITYVKSSASAKDLDVWRLTLVLIKQPALKSVRMSANLPSRTMWRSGKVIPVRRSYRLLTSHTSSNASPMLSSWNNVQRALSISSPPHFLFSISVSRHPSLSNFKTCPRGRITKPSFPKGKLSSQDLLYLSTTLRR